MIKESCKCDYGFVKDIILLTSKGLIRLPYHSPLSPLKIRYKLRQIGFNVNETITWLNEFFGK